ncbi:uncharacterized protein EDB93DRAFT_1107225 [Suillus bovinus]|uniref:uncharacterized protein n=1 Tax=Suillus bovinus TaxID=48563 RepID=UPI001B85CB78|nr:uncharacterized protein EDB93DRAFT_1107225 [Suillus bovinus]KAG2134892.1 hypothetical protein EDB93DRAFT_1107225 [Suillus bovinus]
MDGNMPIPYHEHITPERERHSQRAIVDMLLMIGLPLMYHSQILCQLMNLKQGLFHDLLHGSLLLTFHMNRYQLGNILACHHPPVDYNARLNEQMNAAHNDRRRQRNHRRQQDREEIREQAQAELMAAGMQPMQVPQVHNQPAQPAPAPPVYGAIHYEGAVGPRNFDNPLHYFAPNPAPPLHGPPEPDYDQFNI